MLPPINTEQDARAIMAAGLGKAELEFVMSITAPLYWIIRDGEENKPKNGSAFFLNAGEGVFAVTNNHVVKEWNKDRIDGNVVVALQLGTDLSIDLDGQNAVIAAHDGIDIATFRISERDIASIGKTILTGHQKQWPPGPPQQDRGVFWGGFPGVERMPVSSSETCFGAAPAIGVASSVSEKDISSLIDRSRIIPVLGRGLPPENFDFGGISGGPMLSVIEQGGIRSWALAGVIYQGPNTSLDPAESIAGLEIIKARRAHFIRADGTLDENRWEGLVNLQRRDEWNSG